MHMVSGKSCMVQGGHLCPSPPASSWDITLTLPVSMFRDGTKADGEGSKFITLVSVFKSCCWSELTCSVKQSKTFWLYVSIVAWG